MCISMFHVFFLLFLGSHSQSKHFMYLSALWAISDSLHITSGQNQDYFTDRDNFDLSRDFIKEQWKSSKATHFKDTED